jgi:hypothetical protein
MICPAPLSFDRAAEQVEGMMQQDTASACLEDAIDAARFSSHHKAALWLCLPGRYATLNSSAAMPG